MSSATLLILGAFGLFVILVTAIAEFSSRHLRKVDEAAMRAVQNRLRGRERQNVREMLVDEGLRGNLAQTEENWRRLASLLRVDAGCLRPDDRLENLITVVRSELVEIPEELWRKASLTSSDIFQAYRDDLEDYFSKNISPSRAKAISGRQASTEEEWVDDLLRAKIIDLVHEID